MFLHLDKIEAKTARATWISPVTGEKKDAGTFATFWENAVLLLEGTEG